LPCICTQSLSQLAAKTQGLAALNTGLSQKAAAQMGATATAALDAKSTMSATNTANAELASVLGLKVNATALASLESLAKFSGLVGATMGVDLMDAGAARAIAQLTRSGQVNKMAQTLAATPPAAPINAATAASMASVAALGVNPLAANASQALSQKASAASKSSASGSASSSAKSSASSKSSASASSKGSAKGSAKGAASASQQAAMSAQAAAMGNANAAAAAGMGMNPATAGADALAAAVATMAQNLAALTPLANAINPKALAKASAMFSDVTKANAMLGTSLASGAKVDLKSAVEMKATQAASMDSKLVGSSALSASGASTTSGAMMAAQQAVFQSGAFAKLAIPAVPGPLMALASMLSNMYQATGVKPVQATPCSACFLAAALPPGCLCPKQQAAVPKPDLAAMAEKFNPKISLTTSAPTPSLSGGSKLSAGAGGSAAAGGSAKGAAAGSGKGSASGQGGDQKGSVAGGDSAKAGGGAGDQKKVSSLRKKRDTRGFGFGGRKG